MKNTVFALMIMLVALLAVNASALQISAGTLGSSNQDRISGVSTTITITNNDTVNTVTGIVLSTTADTTKYGLQFTPSTIATLAPNAVATVTVTGKVPLDHNAVEASKSASDYLKEKVFKIGTITANADNSVTATNDVNMQAVNQLSIKKARIDCSDSLFNTGESKTKTLDDGDKVENLRPGMDCTLEIELENKYDQDDDQDANGNDLKIGDIDFDTLSVDVETDDDDVIDINVDDTLDDLSADDTDSLTADITIEEDADDKSYDLDIFVSGKDSNGAIHGEKILVTLEVDRLSHDIVIRRLDISPTKMENCKDSTLQISSTIANFGKRDDDDVAVKIDVADLNLKKEVNDITLDKDDSTNVALSLVVPSSTKPGLYTGLMHTYFDNSAPSNSRSFEFTVEKCGSDEEEDDSTTVVVPPKTPVIVQPPVTDGSTVAVPTPKVRSQSFSESPAYLWTLGGVAVIFALLIIVMLVKLFKRPTLE